MSYHELQPPADLYDGAYDDSLKGRWRSRIVPNLVVVVEGEGCEAGTIAVHAEHNPGYRQDDLPITTLHRHYEGLR